MPKLMMFMKRKPGISFEAFRRHYEEVHIPLVAGWVGHLMTDFKRYYPSHFTNLFAGREDESEAPANDGGVDYDAVSIYSIRDDAALEELLQIASNPEFTRAVTLDEANFADRGASRQSITQEIVGPGLI